MIIGGLQKFSTLDYPEHLSAIVFTQGCNFRCPFCYNPMLVCPKKGSDKINSDSQNSEEGKKVYPQITEEDFFVFLNSRKEKLDGIVITGGEPTMHSDLPEFIQKIKNLGFKVKLDTNGTNPEVFDQLVGNNLLDYVAMDIKSSFEKYDRAIGVGFDLKKVKKSVKIIKDSQIQHEFRTTIVPGLIEKEDIEKMGELLKGADRWFLQQFKSDMELIDDNFKNMNPYPASVLEEMRKIGERFVKKCDVR